MRRFRKSVCPTANRLCPKRCPVPSIDNLGKPYPGCALFKIVLPKLAEKKA